MTIKLEYRSIFISDLHLGSRGCQAEALAAFLKRVRCRRLYLVGDAIDMWRLKKRWYWPTTHNQVVRRILKLARKGTAVVLIPGNHDEAARQYYNLNFGGVRIQRDAVHETADGRKLLITHGDQFDLVVKHARLLSVLGAHAYDQLIALNVLINRLRSVFKRPYWSLSNAVKMKVKTACKFIGAFEQTLAEEARRRGLDGVICGHIHKAEARLDADGYYYNCGDWVESCTALVEHEDGKLQLLDGLAFLDQLREQEAVIKQALGREHPIRPAREAAKLDLPATDITARARIDAVRTDLKRFVQSIESAVPADAETAH